VIAIAVGLDHNCAIVDSVDGISGAAKCWGQNEAAQLGDGTQIDRNVPTQVYGLSSGVIAISAGQYNSCAITLGGGLKCWGINTWGMLGDGTTTGRTTPNQVFGLTSGVVAVANYWAHVCALIFEPGKTSGAVKCWGANVDGRIGDGTLVDRFVPTQVLTLEQGAISISSGRNAHSCAVTTDSSVKCWGVNNNGQVGDGTYEDRLEPISVVGFP
jgi:alpha-tubulin suppressor-like RCC1 family protein